MEEDKSFLPTENLSGERGALQDFFSAYGSHDKGLHIAIVCSDDKNDDKNLQKAISVFSGNNLNCRERHCECCKAQRGIRISKLEDEQPKLLGGHKYYQEGCYWECISLHDQCRSVIDVFQHIVKCMEKLEKESDEANEHLDLMQKQIDLMQRAYNNKTSVLQTQLNECSIRILSNFILSRQETGKGCGNIYILFFLPKAMFDIFREDVFFFPHQIEYVIQGIESAKFYREYYDSPELQATRKFLTENYQNEKNKTPQEVALIVGETKDIDQIESGFPQCKFLRYTEKINSESIVPCEEITMESIDRENYKKPERE